MMEIAIIQIGNSKGIRLSKTLLEKYNIKDKIEIISGMKPGTRYLVSPPAGVKDGMTIEGAS